MSLSPSKEDEEGEDPVRPILNESSEASKEAKDLSSSLNGTLNENLQVLEIDEDLQLVSAPNIPDLLENHENPPETLGRTPNPPVTTIEPLAPGAFGPSARSAFKRPRGREESSGGWGYDDHAVDFFSKKYTGWWFSKGNKQHLVGSVIYGEKNYPFVFKI